MKMEGQIYLWIITQDVIGGMDSLDVIPKFIYIHQNSCNLFVLLPAAKKSCSYVWYKSILRRMV